MLDFCVLTIRHFYYVKLNFTRVRRSQSCTNRLNLILSLRLECYDSKYDIYVCSRSRSPSPDPRSPKYSAPSGKQNTATQKNKRLSLGTFQDTLGSIGALGSLGQDRKGFTQVPILQLADMKPKLIG